MVHAGQVKWLSTRLNQQSETWKHLFDSSPWLIGAVARFSRRLPSSSSPTLLSAAASSPAPPTSGAHCALAPQPSAHPRPRRTCACVQDVSVELGFSPYDDTLVLIWLYTTLWQWWIYNRWEFWVHLLFSVIIFLLFVTIFWLLTTRAQMIPEVHSKMPYNYKILKAEPHNHERRRSGYKKWMNVGINERKYCMPPLYEEKIVTHCFETNNTYWDTPLIGYSTCFINNISLTSLNGSKMILNSLQNKIM